MKNQWPEIDKEGLRKTLGQKDKVFLLEVDVVRCIGGKYE
jgi:hypothetical protein